MDFYGINRILIQDIYCLKHISYVFLLQISTMVGCSLIITTYNWSDALELCLQSILKQKRLPDEIVIGDDGSDTIITDLIKKYQNISPIPIKHCWQEDIGYRINAVRNLAIKNCEYPYIIQIDGDVMLNKCFVNDHLRFAKKGRFILGRRINLSKEKTHRYLKSKKFTPLFGFRNLTVCLLHNFFLYKKTSVRGLRGCNISFWRDDAFNINGYDENMKSKGPNDKEFGIRLVNSGVSAFNMKFYGIQHHFKHGHGKRKSDSESVRKVYQDSTITKKIKCANGLDLI